MTDLRRQQAILKTLIYFSIFSHPLRKEEILQYLSVNTNIKQLSNDLKHLLSLGIIQAYNDYYSLPDAEIVKQISDREHYEKLFEQNKDKAAKSTKLISKFPFVKGIFISGSMSKGVVKPDGDIDFFIITKQEKLWICRSLLIFYKKIIRFNSHKYFCLNYFIGEKNLSIPDENMFTATEIASMIPMYNEPLCNDFKLRNSWYVHFLPNHAKKVLVKPVSVTQKPWPKKVIEKCLNNTFGNKLDRILMQITLRRWKNKFPDFTQEMFDLAMRSKRNVSKHHPNNFQERVLQAIADKETHYLKLLEKSSEKQSVVTTK